MCDALTRNLSKTLTVIHRAFDLVGRGLVHPVIAGEAPLERANDALAMVLEDRAVGRVIVRVADRHE